MVLMITVLGVESVWDRSLGYYPQASAVCKGTVSRMPGAYPKRYLVFQMISLLAVFLLVTIGSAFAQTRTLSFRNMHTNETLTVVYKQNGQYVPDAMQKINHILRDWRRNESIRMNPKLIDLIYDVHQATGSQEPVNVVSGYRSPVTNAALRRRSNGVARNSQHILGNATDLYFPDVPVSKIREVALQFEGGGVGYYPRSNRPFVHLDVGRVRHWPRMSRTQLARVFPDGNTLHVPSDGRPLPRTAPSTNIMVASSDPATEARSTPSRTNQHSVSPTPGSRPLIVAGNVGLERDVITSPQNNGSFSIAGVFGADASATSVAAGPPTASTTQDTPDEPSITLNVAALRVPTNRPSPIADIEIEAPAAIQLAGLSLPPARPNYAAPPEYTASVEPARQPDSIGGFLLASLSGPAPQADLLIEDHSAPLEYHQPYAHDLVTTERAEGMSFASFTIPNPSNMRDLSSAGSPGIALSFTSGRLGNATDNRSFEGPAVRALQIAFSS